MARSKKSKKHSSSSRSTQTPLTMFTFFPKLPIEVRLMTWKLSLPGPRIVHLKQKRLKELDGNWWERVRSDIAMWPCDKPFEQDELAPWEKDDWDAKFEIDYDGDDVFDDLAEVERLEKESEEEEAAFDQRWELPDDWRAKHIMNTPARRSELICRVRHGKTRVDALLELMRDYPSEVCEASAEDKYDYLDHEGITNLFFEYDDDSDANSQHDSHFGDGDDRPKQLRGFSTESIGRSNPSLLFACRESRAVALESYQPMFSSPGALAEIYFDPLRDTLFLDQETFFGYYSHLPKMVAKYLLPGDRAQIRKLSIQAFGSWETRRLYEQWLFNTSLPFPTVLEVTNICDHLICDPRAQFSQKYLDLKIVEFGQVGMSEFGYQKREDDQGQVDSDGEDDLQLEDPRGRFYMKDFRIDRPFIDWDRMIHRHRFSSCVSRENFLWDLWAVWKKENPNSTRPEIKFTYANLIPAADERRFLRDAPIFDRRNNRW